MLQIRVFDICAVGTRKPTAINVQFQPSIYNHYLHATTQQMITRRMPIYLVTLFDIASRYAGVVKIRSNR